MNKKKVLNQQAGFTIIEVLVSGFILIVLGTGILGIQYLIGTSQVTALNSFTIVDESSSIVRQFVREVRNAQQGANGNFLIEKAISNEFIFYSDINGDSTIERVRYYIEGSKLYKGTIVPQDNQYDPLDEKLTVLSEHIRNSGTPIFYYYNEEWPVDSTGNPLPTPADLLEISLVQIFIRINTEASQPNRDYISNAFVQIRNIKSNL